MAQDNTITAPSASTDPRPRRPAALRTAFLFSALLVFWLILAGTIDPQQVVAGGLVAAAVTCFDVRRARPSAVRAGQVSLMLLMRPALVRYALGLAVEIVRANLAVARIVLQPRMAISPSFLRLRTGLRHDLTRVAYATSITLTPGTLSVSLQGDTLIVHALTRRAAEGVRGWEIERRLSALEAAAER